MTDRCYRAHPIIFRVFADEGGSIFRVEIAQIIPARAGPLRHGVRFAHGTIRQIQPILRAGERRLAVGGGLVIFERRRQQRQRAFRQRLVIQIPGGILFPNNRERLAPVTLAAEQPVAQLVIDGLLAEAFFFQPGGDFLFGFGGGQAGDGNFRAGIHRRSPSSVKPCQSVFGIRRSGRLE